MKRAYADRRLILKREGDGVAIYLTNSSPFAFSSVLTYGYTSFDGDILKAEMTSVSLEPYSPAVCVAKYSDVGLDLS